MAPAALLATTVVLIAVAVGASLRRLSERHILHEWSDWSEPIRGSYPWSKATQDRHCLGCNKVTRRKVKVR